MNAEIFVRAAAVLRKYWIPRSEHTRVENVLKSCWSSIPECFDAHERPVNESLGLNSLKVSKMAILMGIEYVTLCLNI